MKKQIHKALRLDAELADKNCPACKGEGGWPCDCEASLCLHLGGWVTCQCVVIKRNRAERKRKEGKP